LKCWRENVFLYFLNNAKFRVIWRNFAKIIQTYISRCFYFTHIFVKNYGKTYFSEKNFVQTNMSQTVAKLSSHQDIFTKNSPFISHAADKFCLFYKKLREKSTFLNFHENFRQDLSYIRKQIVCKYAGGWSLQIKWSLPLQRL
jgi:hypothetical protein